MTTPSVTESQLKLNKSEEFDWLNYGCDAACIELSRAEMESILRAIDPAPSVLRTKIEERMSPSISDRDTFILAKQEARGGDLEFDHSAVISTGEDNGAYVGSYKWISFAGTPLDKEGPVYTAMSVDGFWSNDLGWVGDLKDASLTNDIEESKRFGLLAGTGVCVLAYSAGRGCVEDLPSIDTFLELAVASVAGSDGGALSDLPMAEQEARLISIFDEQFPNSGDIKSVLPALTAIYEKAVAEQAAYLAHEQSKQPRNSDKP